MLALTDFDGLRLDGLQFCKRAYDLFEQILEAEDGVSRLRTRPTVLEKRLLDELLPICSYVQAFYGPGRFIEVQWTNGNQVGDAKIFQRGKCVTEYGLQSESTLEATCVMHRNEHLMRRRLERAGGAFGLEGLKEQKGGLVESVPISYSGQDFVRSFAELVSEQIRAKAAKAYPADTVLVIQCSLNMLYLDDDWHLLVQLIRPAALSTRFSEVYVSETMGRHSKIFHPSSARG